MFLLVSLIISPLTLIQAQPVAEWENPAINQVNTELPHATFIPFNTQETALTLPDEKSPN